MAAGERPRFPQSAVIPWRQRRGRLEVLVITSRSGRRWGIPKGLIERGMTALASAQCEALEEAGVEGVPDPEPVGVYRYEKWGGICEVEVYAMQVQVVHDAWDEDDRERRWLPAEMAAERVGRRALGKILRRFAKARTPSGG